MNSWVLKAIDDVNRQDHFYLRPDDKCFYCLEYTSGEGYEHSKGNDFIFNFKKSVSTSNQPQYQYKINAIEEAAVNLERLLSRSLERTVMVPVPPSKTKAHAEYDDRMLRLLNRVKVLAEKNGITTDVIELVEQTIDMEPSHARDDRSSHSELEAAYTTIDPHEISDKLSGKKIFVFDDVLTTGTHFKAMQSTIARVYEHQIAGVFIARRIFKTVEHSDSAGLS